MKNNIILPEIFGKLTSDNAVVQNTNEAYKRGIAMQKAVKEAEKTVKLASDSFQAELIARASDLHVVILTMKASTITK